jgi:hypothetical protein
VRSHAGPLLLGSVVVGVVAVLAGWLVSAATLPYGVPADAVAFLGIAVMILTTGLGSMFLGRRWPADTVAEHAAALVGPVVLGLVMVGWSTAPLWFRVATLVAFVAAGTVGLRNGSSDSDVPARRSRSEVGSGSLEFVGVVILAVVLVVASVGAVASKSPTIKGTIAAEICQILGGDCQAPPGSQEDDYRPECDVSTATNKVDATVDVAFIRLQGGGLVQRVEKSNGDVEITLLKEGRGGAVAAAGAHGNVRLGEHSLGVDVEAEAAATVGIQAGETYVFSNAEDADAFQDYLQGEMAQDAAGAVNPLFGAGNWVVEKVTGEEPPENSGVQKTYTRFDVTIEAKAEASAGFGTGAGAEATFMEAIGTETDRGANAEDPSDDRSTVFIQVDWGVAANAGIPVIAGADFSHGQSGMIKVTTDAEGAPVEVQFVDTTSGGFQVGVVGDQDFNKPAEGNPDGDGWRPSEPGQGPEPSWGVQFTGGQDSATTVTQTLALDTPERQQAFADWVTAAGGTNLMASVGASVTPWVDSEDGDNVTSFGDGADGFARLMRNDAQVSVVEYEGTSWGLGGGAGASLGVKVSADAMYEDTQLDSVEAMYLGAPGADGTRPAYELPECVS